MTSAERTQISIRVPVEMIGKFEDIAMILDRDRSWVMLTAMKYYLDREGLGLLQDAAGIAAVDRGETVEWSVALGRLDAAIDRGEAASSKKAG